MFGVLTKDANIDLKNNIQLCEWQLKKSEQCVFSSARVRRPVGEKRSIRPDRQ
jgi:hypothetical protein